jgi:hypothetical protein
LGFTVDLVVGVGGGSKAVFGAGDDEIVYGREDKIILIKLRKL